MRWSTTSLGAALVLTTAVALVPIGGSSAQTSPRTITLFEGEAGGTFRFIDNPPRSPVANADSPKARFSMGDQGYWTGVVRDRKGGERRGRIFGTEVVMRGTRYPHVTNIVHAVFALTDGQIIVEQVVDETRSDKTPAAVIGGTGAYEGARGMFLAKPANGGNQYTITLLP
jgi:hypothetical protein